MFVTKNEFVAYYDIKIPAGTQCQLVKLTFGGGMWIVNDLLSVLDYNWDSITKHQYFCMHRYNMPVHPDNVMEIEAGKMHPYVVENQKDAEYI